MRLKKDGKCILTNCLKITIIGMDNWSTMSTETYNYC